jgi:hypothetical protein
MPVSDWYYNAPNHYRDAIPPRENQSAYSSFSAVASLKVIPVLSQKVTPQQTACSQKQGQFVPFCPLRRHLRTTATDQLTLFAVALSLISAYAYVIISLRSCIVVALLMVGSLVASNKPALADVI